MKPAATKVRIFGNGMMEYRADYDLPDDHVTPFELTLKKDHLDDILTTLRVRGDIRIPQPLTFSATNAEETKLKLVTGDPIGSLITGMPGAKLSVRTAQHGDVRGRNMGIDTVNSVLDGDRVIPQRFLVLQDNGRIRRLPLDSIEDWGFVEEADQSEVSKALDALSATIRPGTTLVRFGLQGKPKEGQAGGTSHAALKWVEPDAAPLMTYRLGISKDNTFTLEGWATIHNFTDQPWEGTTVELVSGTPHTFAGDTAVATVPQRDFVRLVDAKAVGGRTVVVGMGPRSAQGPPARKMMRAFGGDPEAEGTYAASAMVGGGGLEAVQHDVLAAPEFAEAEVVDAGGMQRLVCPHPVDRLEAKKSTLVFMFSRELAEARTVLIYRQATGPRPDRAFRLKNTIGVSLPKGPIAVDMETVDKAGHVEEMAMGKAIFEATQPNEGRLVVYATDLNVTVRSDRKKSTRRILGVSLKNGIGFTRVEDRGTTEYRVVNVGTEEVELYLDHLKTFGASEVTATGGDARDFEVLPDGYFRATVTVPAGGDFLVEVEEVYRHVDQMFLAASGTNRAGGLLTVIGHSRDRLKDDPAVRAALQIADKVDAKRGEIARTQGREQKLNAQYQRALTTLNGLKDGQARSQFEAELTRAHHSLKQVEDDELPALNAQLSALEDEYQAALRALVVSWDDPEPKRPGKRLPARRPEPSSGG